MTFPQFNSVYVVGAAGFWLNRWPQKPRLSRRQRRARRDLIAHLSKEKFARIVRDIGYPST
jgi:hypothetical protein